MRAELSGETSVHHDDLGAVLRLLRCVLASENVCLDWRCRLVAKYDFFPARQRQDQKKTDQGSQQDQKHGTALLRS